MGCHYRDAINTVLRKQTVRRNGDGVQCHMATEHTDEALFDDLDSFGKPGGVAKLLLQPRKLGSDNGMGVVRDIRQFRHGHPEKAVEARWLKMNGKGVNTSADQQLSPSVRLRTHNADTRRGVT